MTVAQLAVAVGIPVAGWLVTHFSHLRAQRQQLRHQVLNEARLSITEAIRTYQDWLSEVAASYHGAAAYFDMNDTEASAFNWAHPHLRWQQLQGDVRRTKDWLARLEEYDALFPEARRARLSLAARHGRVIESFATVRAVVAPLMRRELPDVGEVRQTFGTCARLATDQAALMDDLRIHVQNAALKEILGREANPRVPQDESVPRLIPAPDGSLQVVEGGGVGA